MNRSREDLEREIQELKQLNKELTERQKEIGGNNTLLNSILDSQLDIIIFSLDTNYCYTAFSDYHKVTIKKIWGAEIGVGMNMLDIISDPDDRLKARKNFDRALSGVNFRFEEEYGDPNLYRTYYENIYNPIFGHDGKVIGLVVFVIDITERKKTEKALELNQRKFQSLFNYMSEGAALHEIIYNDQGVADDYRITETNPAFSQLLGLDREKVTGKTSREAYKVNDPPYLDVYSRVAETGVPIVFETYFPPLKKHFSISVYSPGKGSFATIFQDITIHKESEQTLRVSLTKYKVLFESFHFGITISDPAGSIIETNKIAEELLGLSQEELRKRTISGEEWRVIRSDGTTMPDSEYPSVRALLQKQVVENVEMGIIKENNNVTWLNVSAVPIPLEGYGVAITYLNITNRKLAEEALARSEARFRSYFELPLTGRAMISTGKDWLDVNTTLCKMLGYSKEELLHTSWEIVTHPDDIERCQSQFDKVLTGEIEGYNIDKRYLHKQGHVIFTHLAIQCVRKPDRSVDYLVAVIIDISDLKMAENDLRASEIKFRELNATKDKFFSIIAHDLRSPFSSIIGFSDILVEQIRARDYDGIEKYAEIIQHSSQQAMELLVNLIEWTRSQTGRIEYNPEYFDFVNFLKETIPLFINIARQKSISVIEELPMHEPVFADKIMLSTVIRNLISNAIKFTRPGGQILIKTFRQPGFLKICVSDNGIGIPKNQIGKLFLLSENYSTPGTNKEKGTGLGLVLCKEFTEKHGGKIWAESTPGAGSTFCFELPFPVDGPSGFRKPSGMLF